MKANRKFVEGEKAVSAVIGVILMVAITVAIAATVYVYVSGMLTPTTTGKTMSAIQQSTGATGTFSVTYKVTSTDAGIPWTSVTVNCFNGTATSVGVIDQSSGNIAVGTYFTINCAAAGTYTIDLIYGGNIIWTSPSVAVI